MPLAPQHPPLPHPSNHLMILRIRCLLVQHFYWLAVQAHEVSLEPDPGYPCDIIPMIILHKHRQTVDVIEQSPFDRMFLDL